MKWLRAFAPVAVAIALAWLLSGRSASCGKQPILQLIQVLDVTPRNVELADRIAIVGAGFPPGKPARVTFRGVLRRPGENPEEGVELGVWGMAIGAEQVAVSFDEATAALFCGAGDRATHTTFEGEVEVAFAGAVAGTPPIAGVLDDVTLDVLPSATAASVDRDREGERVLAFLGLRVAAGGPMGSGLRVESVEPSSRGQGAGLVVGDVLTTFDGVRVASFGDVAARPGEREASLGVRHGGAALDVTRRLSIDGLRRAPPTDLLTAALCVASALALVLLFFSPTPRAFATSMAHAASRVRLRVAAAGRGAAGSRVLGLLVREVLPPAGASMLVDASACTALAVMPFGQYVVAAKLDVVVLFLVAVTAMAGAVLASERSTWAGLSGALQTAWQHVPAAAAIATVVLTTGSLRVQEIERAQGGWPWDWLAFRSPAALVALLLLLSATRIDLAGPTPPNELASLVDDGGSPAPGVSVGRYARAASRAHRFIVAGLATVLFLGGWSLPGITSAQQDSHPALEVLGCFGLFAKTGTLLLLLAWTRWAWPTRTLGQRTRLAAIWLLPSAMAVLGATLAWLWWGPARSAQVMVSGSLVSVVVLTVTAAAQRLRHGLVSSGGDVRLSAFL